ncbi:acyl--CoA ligase [Aeromicrobium sp. CFBP 8757]|uniref:class I adenylate-forming enzyme family protein n=1 Tax=Aeromicrobium sp. CFBP 8757 TaxID=2775288 RepID=UPI001782BEC7|nr:class I adenylate-forming enzyme family protein [Aeromicrobium sp. CFBP 8757]MBD8605445.1 acyl--CoA ligase [Aeromicrobium sp. CFBP 8757]
MASPDMSSAPFTPDDPSAIAAWDGDRSLSYEQWDDRAARLAEGLAGLGLGNGDRVAVRMHTRLEWLVTSLAIAKIGGTLVGLNYRFTPREVLPILRDSGTVALILDDDDPAPLVQAIGPLALRAVVHLSDRPVLPVSFDALIDKNPAAVRAASDLAPMILYSSGTTGAPKGVLLSDRRDAGFGPAQLAEYAHSVAFEGAVGGPGTVSLVSLPLHHGIGPAYTRSALASGGQVVLQRKFDPVELPSLVERHRITHWTCVPTMLTRALAQPVELLRQHDLSSLRFIQVGGAPVGNALKERAATTLQADVYESYGAIETGMIAGASLDENRAKPGTVGRPFRHVDIRIVDEAGDAVPPGTSGEVLIRTPMIVRGYLGQEPLGPDKVDAQGYYRSGDVGHLDEDGYLFLSDRISDLIIAGGANINPLEIEEVLSTHPAVSLAAVVGVPDADRGEQPVAFVELRPGASATEAELIGSLDGVLAKYKWPRRVHFVDTMPTNSSGKLLKRDLRTLLEGSPAT